MALAYSSYMYLICFLGATFLAYYIMPMKLKWSVLLAASCIYYWINSGKLLFFVLITSVAIYFAGIFIGKIQSGFELSKKALDKPQRKELKKIIGWQKKAVVAITLAIIFGILVFLKYYNFLGGNFNSLFSLLHLRFTLPKLKLILPLGISYYTLQAASYIIDVYRGKYAPTRNFGKIALFLCFFPQIVEGPIGRFDQLGDQLYEGHRFDYNSAAYGMQLIGWGLAKKMVIADRCNILVANIYDNLGSYSGSVQFIAGIFYTLQIYAEFSGCIDIVTGSAQLFGINLAKNFERPFFSKSVGEFWRRWHITLGAWLRDYIFYSVSLSRPFSALSKWTSKHMNRFFGGLVPAAFATFFVWLGNGLWHGSGWKYITYGMYYYVIMLAGMLCEPLFLKFYEKTHIKRDSGWFPVLRVLRTCILVVFGMMMFRAQDIPQFAGMVKAVFTDFGAGMLTDGTLLSLGVDAADYAIIGVATVLLLVVSILQEKGHSIRQEVGQKNIVLRWALYIGLVLLIVIFGAYGSGYQQVDFIYAQF